MDLLEVVRLEQDVVVEKAEATKGRAKENRRVRPRAKARTLERKVKTGVRWIHSSVAFAMSMGTGVENAPTVWLSR